MTRPACSLAGCGRPHHGHGYCRPHHARWLRHGAPLAEVPIGAVRAGGESSRSVRRRLQAERGSAVGQCCGGCGAAAVVWSYDGTDPDARTDPVDGHRYSLDPARYRPLCRACQRRTSAPRRGGRAATVVDVERAARLYRAGATARGVACVLRTSPAAVLSALRTHGVPIRAPARQRRQPTS